MSVAADAGTPALSLLLLAILALLPASDLASALVQRFITELVGPRRLPKLELAGEVPEASRALVAIPMLLTDEAEIREVALRLEIHYLANPDAQLRFALLSDWSGRALGEPAGRRGPSRGARRGASESSTTGTGGRRRRRHRFWVLHRRRLWNEREGVWMGWERKRGKLRELNRLLRGATRYLLPASEAGEPPPSGFVTSSPSMPTPACRARPCAGWSARSRIL